jgi:hypothetical protein
MGNPLHRYGWSVPTDTESREAVLATRDAVALLNAWNEGPDQMNRQIKLVMSEIAREIDAAIAAKEARAFVQPMGRIEALISELCTLGGATISASAQNSGKSYGAIFADVQSWMRLQQEALGKE